MAQRTWQACGPEYSLSRGGRLWILRLDDECPGLRAADQPADHILSLAGLCAVGRRDGEALSGRSLVNVERIGPRVVARFAPENWSELQVVASWSPCPDLDGIDLEVEALASSVGELKALEVVVASRIADPGARREEPKPIWVHPRDARSAGLSYDGRVPPGELARLTTEPAPAAMEPRFAQTVTYGPPVAAGRRYVEFAHPYDVARRIIEGESSAGAPSGGDLSVRHGLFGHDLEKGVVLRGRLRGLWIPPGDTEALSRQAFRAFLDSPLPLGR